MFGVKKEEEKRRELELFTFSSLNSIQNSFLYISHLLFTEIYGSIIGLKDKNPVYVIDKYTINKPL